ncbi:MAG: ACP S-malonyltransferase [Francisellaceae bacterium]|jgi:[acyl-carrier-protein] S-malonyltransferase|nr:ACP S-malonyltransferase [Francisellaceae bacterium]MBT6208379.1 ACP S-malonyltransferase [Francisellaceae bacterium]MBT6538172.1 ACP S-malonyltransferase [Francisellaceae bacterium]
MSYAVVFPGQGSQSVGMLKNIYDDSSIVRDTFNEASDILGYDLWQLISLGPKESLNQTEFTQPALLASGIAVFREFKNCCARILPEVLSGHSLGEYTALVAAEAIDYGSALKLVQTRGKLMQKAVPSGEGAMLAILGLSDDQVLKACDLSSQGEIIAPANFNSPGQVVAAGTKAAVERLAKVAKDLGAKRTVELPVSVPSHCMMLKEAADEFKGHLSACNWKMPSTLVLHNRSAKSSDSVIEIVEMLYEQLFSPVLWVDVINNISSKTATVLEVGPGAVLTGLNKRINKNIRCMSINTMDSINSELENIK